MAIHPPADEPSPAFTIPTVDLSDYLKDPDSPEAQEVVVKLRDACKTSGFFQIVGHGVPSSLQRAVFEAARKVFSLPSEEKMKLKGKNARGYELLGTQTLQKGAKPDMKEGYALGPAYPNSKPPYRDFACPNIWPSTNLIPASDFQDPLTKYHERLSALSFTIMTILGRGLAHLDTSIFVDFCKDPLAALKLLHYPPHPTTKDELQFGAGAHTDFGAITLLLQDDQPGLQVLNRATGDWVDVPPNRDAYVVNVGDMLDRWTKGEYKSNVHRVINLSGKDRYSAPFFFDGNLDCVIKPLDGSVGGESYTVEEYMRSRYKAVYAD